MEDILTAIIDDGVSAICGVKEHYVVTGNEVMPFMPTESYHGTMCALTFTSITGTPHRISICLCRDDNSHLCAGDLITALKWCIGNGVKLVSVSAGVVRSDKLSLLADFIKQAKEAGMIIVASADNSGEIIYPACMDGVFGVCADYVGLLTDNEYIYVADSFDGINWVIALDNNFSDSLALSDYDLSNSRAAAVMAGIIFNIMWSKPRDFTIDLIIAELMKSAKKCDDYGNVKFMQRKIKTDYDSNQTVIVILYEGALKQHDEIKDILSQEGYRVISVKDENPDFLNSVFSFDFLNAYQNIDMNSALNLIASATKPDLILIDVMNHEDLIQIEYDVLIGDGVMLNSKVDEVLLIDNKNLICNDAVTAIISHFS